MASLLRFSRHGHFCISVRICRQVNGIIFFVYAPGLLLYVLKWPKSNFFGFHELFHTSVLAGHVVSMACDLRDIVTPCARIARACTS